MSDIRIRRATLDDLGAIVDLLMSGEASIPPQSIDPSLQERYLAAFEAISADANNELIVAEMDDKVVGTMQLTHRFP